MIVILHCFILGGVFAGVVFYLIGQASKEDIEEYLKKGNPGVNRMREFKESLSNMEKVNQYNTKKEIDDAANRNQRFLESLGPEGQELFKTGLEKYQEQIDKMKNKSEDELLDDYNSMQANEFRWLMFKIF